MGAPVLTGLLFASMLGTFGLARASLRQDEEIASSLANEEREEESECKFRALLDGTPESIVIHRGFQVLYANSAFEASIGKGKEAWSRLFAENSRRLFEGRFRDGLETGVTARYRRVEVNGRSGPIWVDMLTRRLDWEGRPALQTNLLDVTAQVQAEAAAQQDAKAEALNKSQMLANMAHELRTPMTGVLGMADLLLQTKLDDQQHRLLTGLRSSADLLLTLVDDCLDFSRLEADAMRLEPVDFAPRRAVDTVIQLLEPESRRKQIELIADVDPSVPAALRGDPVRLQQILFNLVGNAIKFTEEGRVQVRMQAKVEDGHAQIHIEIQDTGVGIAPERIPQLFERWDQGDKETRARFGGNGLGLAISRRLSQMMGGDISVRSERGRGSIFGVDLIFPVGNDRSIDGPRAPIVPLGWARGLSLLLAEDEDVNRTMLTVLTEAEGFRVTSVADGAAAVEAAKTKAFDLVLLDMHLPVLSGAEAAAAIRELPSPFGRARLIGSTADAVLENRSDLQSLGIEALLTKPFDRNDFAWLAQSLLSPSAFPPPAPEAPMPKITLVSQTRLDHLASHLGQQRLDQLSEQFRRRARDEVGQVEEALFGRDADHLSEACHRLAGFAANFGADRLAAEARGVEAPRDDVERTQALDRLQRCLEDTLHEMDARMTRPHHERQ
jgi:PAS domain S-box-containing protein